MSGSESAPTIPGANMGPEVSPEFVEKVLGSCAFKSVASTIVGEQSFVVNLLEIVTVVDRPNDFLCV